MRRWARLSEVMSSQKTCLYKAINPKSLSVALLLLNPSLEWLWGDFLCASFCFHFRPMFYEETICSSSVVVCVLSRRPPLALKSRRSFFIQVDRWESVAERTFSMSLARAHTKIPQALMWPLIFHLVSTRWDIGAYRYKISWCILLAPPENSSRQMSRGSGSDVIYDFHLILSAWRCAESGWKKLYLNSAHQQQVHHFLLTRLHASRAPARPLSHSPRVISLDGQIRAPGIE